MKTAVQLLQQQQQNIQRRSISNNNFMVTGSNISPTNSALINPNQNISHFKLNNTNLMSNRNQDAISSSPTPLSNKVKKNVFYNFILFFFNF